MSGGRARDPAPEPLCVRLGRREIDQEIYNVGIEMKGQQYANVPTHVGHVLHIGIDLYGEHHYAILILPRFCRFIYCAVLACMFVRSLVLCLQLYHKHQCFWARSDFCCLHRDLSDYQLWGFFPVHHRMLVHHYLVS